MTAQFLNWHLTITSTTMKATTEALVQIAYHRLCIFPKKNSRNIIAAIYQ